MKILNTTIAFLITLLISNLSFAQTCNASATVNYTSTPGEVQIIDNSTTSSGPAATYSWVDFYQSPSWNYEGTVNLQPNSSTATYQFTQNGTYYYYISVQDSLTNCYDSIGGSITINNITANCDANFTFNNTVNNVVDFSPDSYDSNLNYHWDFGNGLSSMSPNASHTYVNPGTYTVCLTVWDSSGVSNCSDTVCQTVEIDTNACNISADFSYTQLGNGTYEFQINNVTNHTIYDWNIGSGNYYGPNATHTFPSNGQFNVSVIATDTTIPTCQDTSLYTINVNDADSCDYDASFSFVETSNNQFEFSPNNYDPSAAYDWNFGDGNYSTDDSPTHTYSNSGTYTVCLTIWDSSPSGSCADTVCQTITVGQTADLEKESALTDVKLFPNPATSTINITLRGNASYDYNYQIIDVMGNQIEMGDLNSNQNVASKEINVEQLQQGVYFVQIIEASNKEKVKTLKFIKK